MLYYPVILCTVAVCFLVVCLPLYTLFTGLSSLDPNSVSFSFHLCLYCSQVLNSYQPKSFSHKLAMPPLALHPFHISILTYVRRGSRAW